MIEKHGRTFASRAELRRFEFAKAEKLTDKIEEICQEFSLTILKIENTEKNAGMTPALIIAHALTFLHDK